MFDYLQKFNTLPANLRESVSSPAAMTVISELETKYKIDLAATVMKVMVKTISLADLSIYFVSDFSLTQEQAKKLTADLKERLFFPVANYLGYNASYSTIVPKTAPASVHLVGIEKIIKDAGLTFAGLELNSRFKNILTTYLKGIRSRVDTRLTLNKNIAAGGLGLEHVVIDKIFKAADELNASHTLPSGTPLALPKTSEESKNGLDKVRALYEKPGTARDIPYDLKTAILSGSIKKPSTPANLPTETEESEKLLEAPEKELKLEAPEVELKIAAAPVKSESIEKVIPSVAPLVKPTLNVIAATTPIKPIAASIPVTTTAIANSLNKTVEALIPPIESKIVKPPERKALLSNLFNKVVKPAPAPAPIKQPEKQPEVSPKKPLGMVSVASLRSAATPKPVPKAAPITATTATIANKSIPKVMGPLEELRYLDLVNFRRLGASPLEAANKVEAKIKLLEKDGYDRMVAGVLAWRNSLINLLYLKMGQEALIKDISFKQLAENYQAAKTPGFLNWDEIEAIAALNSRLMF